jgi:hypothetical protein
MLISCLYWSRRYEAILRLALGGKSFEAAPITQVINVGSFRA